MISSSLHEGRLGMNAAKREHWKELCEEAAREQDPEKLIALAEEIDRELEQKHPSSGRQTEVGPPKSAPARHPGRKAF